MQIPISLESLGQDRYRAEAPAPFSVSAEGRSSNEAVEKVRSQIEQKLSSGKQIIVLDMPLPEENPWIKFAGHLKDGTFLSDFQQALAEYRRERDPDDE
jgi:hypothetical protein